MTSPTTPSGEGSAAGPPRPGAPATTDTGRTDTETDPGTDVDATVRMRPTDVDPRWAPPRPGNRPAPPSRRAESAGWLMVALLTAVVGLTWLPLDAPLGNDHDGRNNVLNVMQVEQVQQRGLAETDLGSSLGPYFAREGYAHHPPAMKVPYLAVSALPVPAVAAVRAVSYGLGLLVLPGLAWLLRARGVPWAGVLVGVGAVAATPLFWAYGRLHGPVGAAVVLAAVVAHLRSRRDRDTSWPQVLGAGALAAFVAASSWFAMGVAALSGLWLWAGRGRVDRTVVVVGWLMALSAAATLWWVVGLSGTEDIGSSVAGRITDTGRPFDVWLDRIVRWFDQLVPTWARVAGAFALVGALVDRRVRVPFLAAVVLAVGWVAGVPGGSFVHDYWIFPVVLPLGVGLAGFAGRLTDRVEEALRDRPPQQRRDTVQAFDLGLAAVAVLVASAAVLGLSSGPFGTEYESEPRDMGAALALARPAPVTAGGQEIAWHSPTVPGLVTVAWEWERPAEPLDEAALRAADGDDLVLVRCSRPPRYLPSGSDVCAGAVPAADGPVVPRGTAVEVVGDGTARVGDYAVTDVAYLRGLAGLGS